MNDLHCFMHCFFLLVARHLILPSGNLQIGEVRMSDQGVYQCIAMNPLSRQRRTSPTRVHLHVNGEYLSISARMARCVHRQTDSFIKPICYRFFYKTNIIKGKETLSLTTTWQWRSLEPPQSQGSHV